MKTNPRDVAMELLTSVQYQESVRQRAIDGELPAEIEARLWELAYGPPRRLSVADTTKTAEGGKLALVRRNDGR